MPSHEQPTELLDATIGVLEESGTDLTPQRGTGIIDQWLVQLRQADNATELTNVLERVKTQLKSDQIDADELGQLLSTLAKQTAEFSTLMGSEGSTPRLEGLSSALRSMAGQLGDA